MCHSRYVKVKNQRTVPSEVTREMLKQDKQKRLVKQAWSKIPDPCLLGEGDWYQMYTKDNINMVTEDGVEPST